MAVAEKTGRLSPELKEWLDRVIVPALLREWLAEKSLESEASPVQDCPRIEQATAEEKA